MASILEAIQAAQERNKQRDVMNAQRQMPVLPIIPTNEVKPIVIDTGGGGEGAKVSFCTTLGRPQSSGLPVVLQKTQRVLTDLQGARG